MTRPPRLLGETDEPDDDPLPGRLFQSRSEPYPRHWAVVVEDVSATLEQNLSAGRLTEALDQLPPLWRGVLLDHDRRQVPLASLATRWGLSPASAQKVLNAARAELWLRLTDL